MSNITSGTRFLGNLMVKKRVARSRHVCGKCGGVIEIRDEYYHTTERFNNIITQKPVCEACWTGPKMQVSTKAYKYKPKIFVAKSDGAKVELRQQGKRRGYFNL